jgi:hypothetical protein
LNLTEKDVSEIRSHRRRWGWIIGIASFVAALIMFAIGYLAGILLSNGSISGDGGSSSGDGYPYAGSLIGITSLRSGSPCRFLLPLLLAAGFLTGISKPVFGNAIKYGVFQRKGNP